MAKRGLGDDALEVVGRQAEFVGQGARRHLGEILARQAGQFKARRAGADRQAAAFAGQEFDLHLGAVRQLADDVVEHVGGRGGGAVAQDVGGQRLDDLDVQVGGGELQTGLARLDQDVGQDRDGVAALDHALDMVQRLEEGAAFDVDLHGLIAACYTDPTPISRPREDGRKHPFFLCLGEPLSAPRLKS